MAWKREEEKNKSGVMEMDTLKRSCGVSRLDRIPN